MVQMGTMATNCAFFRSDCVVWTAVQSGKPESSDLNKQLRSAPACTHGLGTNILVDRGKNKLKSYYLQD